MPSSRRDLAKDDPEAFTALTHIHNKAVVQCSFSPDTDQILTGGEDSFVVLWNVPPRNIVLHDETINDDHKLVCYRLTDHKTPVMSISVHKKIFISASKDGHVKLWKLIVDNSQTNLPMPRSSNYHRHSTPSLSRNPQTSLTRETYKQPPSDAPADYICSSHIIRSVDISLCSRKFASASDDQNVKIWSTESKNKCLAAYNGAHSNWIKCVRWSKTTDTSVASCGDDGKLCIWDTRSYHRGTPNMRLEFKKRMQLNCLEWHPIFDHHIATGSGGSQDPTCAVWDLRNKKQIQVYKDHTGSINSVAFNPGGSLLMTGSNDKTSKIYDVCHGESLYTLLSHKDAVTSVCFDSTGDLIATASRDKTVTLWKRKFEVIDIEKANDESDVDLDYSEQNFENLNGSYEDNYRSAHQHQEEYLNGHFDHGSHIENLTHRKHIYYE